MTPYLLMIIPCLMTSLALAEQRSGFEEWSIQGDCPEPRPIPNAVRTVNWANVQYVCLNSNAGSRIVLCNDGDYYGDFPTCDFSCGSQAQWASVSATSMAGTSLGDTITFQCQSSGVTKTWTGECTYDGWDADYPVCLANEMLNLWRTKTTSTDSYIYWNSCVNNLVTGDFPWISTSLVWDNSLRDVKTVIVRISPYIDNNWSVNFDIVFLRQSTEVSRVNIQRVDIYSDFEYEAEASAMHIGVDEVRIQAADGIGSCNIEVYGQINYGICPTLLNPFYLRSQVNGDIATLTCGQGFNYIGGARQMKCDYDATWAYDGPVDLQCTDRADLVDSIDSIEPDLFSGGLQGGGVSNDGDSDGDGTDQSAETLSEFAATLTREAMVERVIILMDSGSSVQDVNVSFDDVTTGLATLTPCEEDTDYSYGDYRVFFCPRHPRGHRVLFTAQTDQASIVNQVDYLFVLGSPLETSEFLECFHSDNGEEYLGRVSMAMNGEICMEWAVADPTLSGQDFPDGSVTLASNYCRNPGGVNSRPFCMTSQGKSPCPVLKCSYLCSMTDNGWDFMGELASSTRGSCRSWADDDIPYIADWDFPDGSRAAAKNNCRNPGKLQSGPWCYVDDDTTDGGTTRLVPAPCNVPHVCPSSTNWLLEEVFYEIEPYNNQESWEWYKIFRMYLDSNDPNEIINSGARITRVRELCDDAEFLWYIVVTMRETGMGWVTILVNCTEPPPELSSSSSITPLQNSATQSVVGASDATIALSETIHLSTTMFDQMSATSNNIAPSQTSSQEIIILSSSTAVIVAPSEAAFKDLTPFSTTSHHSDSLSTEVTPPPPSTPITERFVSITRGYPQQFQTIYSQDLSAPTSTLRQNSDSISYLNSNHHLVVSSTLILHPTNFDPVSTLTLAPSIFTEVDKSINATFTSFADISDSISDSITNTISDTTTIPTTTVPTTTVPDTTVPTTSTSSAASSSTTSLEALTNGTTSSKQCACSCSTIDAISVTQDDLESIHKAIKKELFVDRRKLSSTIRRKTSAKDDRPEAVTSGIFTVIFMTSAITAVVISDAVQIFARFGDVFQKLGLR